MHAWWPPPASLGETEEAKRIIEEDNNRLTEVVRTVVKQGTATPPRLLIDMVENNPYVVLSNELRWPDLLVMGTHSMGRLASTVSIGSLARHLLVESTCDVLMSRP